MKPENYNNETNLTNESVSATVRNDRKAELCNSIRKHYRKELIKNIVISVLIAGLFVYECFNMCHLCSCDGYRSGWFFILFSATVWVIYKAVGYRRILRLGSGQVIQQQIDRIAKSEGYFYQFIMWPCAMLYTCLRMQNSQPWYLILVVMLVVTAVMAIYWVMMRQVTIDGYRNIDVEELVALEKDIL